MCRNIKLLFNFAPPVTRDEIRSASLQFAAASSRLLDSLKTNAPPRNRIEEAEKARVRGVLRFSRGHAPATDKD
jgi:hypothetical protein